MAAKKKKKINVRAKGASGEREFCKWMKLYLKLDYTPERNVDQVRNGGTDIIWPPFSIEVKRRESMDFDSWWCQSVKDAKDNNLEPIVAFRVNGGRWEFLISSKLIGGNVGWMHVQQRVFIPYAMERIEWWEKEQLRLEEGQRMIK